MFSYTIVDADTGACIGDEIEVTLRSDDTFVAHDPERIFTGSIDNVAPQSPAWVQK